MNLNNLEEMVNRIKKIKHVILFVFLLFGLVWLIGCSNIQQIATSEAEAAPITIQFKTLDIDVEFKNIGEVAISPDSKQMAVSDDGMYLHLLGLQGNGRWEETIQVEKPGIRWISWSPMEPLIALSSPGFLEIWNADEQVTSVKGEIGSINPPPSVWSTDGKRIAVSVPMNSMEYNENVAEIYNSHTMNLISTVRRESEMDDSQTISWNPDSEDVLMVLSSKGDFNYVMGDSVSPYGLHLWVASGSMSSFWLKDNRFLLILNEVRFSQEDSDKRNVRIAMYDGIDLITEYVVSSPPIDIKKVIGSADYNPGKRLLATYTQDGLLTLYWIMDDEIIYGGEAKVPEMGENVKIVFDPSCKGIYLYSGQKIIYAELTE